MKYLSLILALYVLLLSAKPCCSDDNCGSNNQQTKTEQTNHNQHDTGCNGACSPFFTCGTCVGFSFSTVTFSLAPQTFFLTEHFSIYTPSFCQEFHHSIWQPPKIS